MIFFFFFLTSAIYYSLCETKQTVIAVYWLSMFEVIANLAESCNGIENEYLLHKLNIYEYLLQKLTKVLYVAVKFIFWLRDSALHMHLLPYLKRLHFFTS